MTTVFFLSSDTGKPTAMYEVRPLMLADAPAVQRIYAMCISTADWLPERARTAVDFARASVGERVHVATAPNGEVAGFVSVQPSRSFVHHLFVHPDAHGKGVGRQLLLALEPVAWRLKCVRANERAIEFYLKCGWREIESGESEHGPYALLEWQRHGELLRRGNSKL